MVFMLTLMLVGVVSLLSVKLTSAVYPMYPVALGVTVTFTLPLYALTSTLVPFTFPSTSVGSIFSPSTVMVTSYPTAPATASHFTTSFAVSCTRLFTLSKARKSTYSSDTEDMYPSATAVITKRIPSAGIMHPSKSRVKLSVSFMFL